MNEKLSEFNQRYAELDEEFHEEWHPQHGTNMTSMLIYKLMELETCDLCDEPAEPAEYRQCQNCMNDKLIGSHTDEEWDKLKSEINQLKENIKKLVQLRLMTETERAYYYKELANLVY